MHRRREPFERARHYQIADGIENQVHLHAGLRLANEMLLEAPAQLIIFPDVGLQKDALLCRVNCREHRLVEICAIGEELECIAIQRRRWKLLMREVRGRAATFALLIHDDQRTNRHQLKQAKAGENSQREPHEEAAPERKAYFPAKRHPDTCGWPGRCRQQRWHNNPPTFWLSHYHLTDWLINTHMDTC